MALKKRFLRPTPKLPKLSVTLLYGIFSLGIAAIIYYFLILLREKCIILVTQTRTLRIPWDRTPEHLSNSNFILACTSALTAFGIFFILVGNDLLQNRLKRYKGHHLIHISVLMFAFLSLSIRFGYIQVTFSPRAFDNLNNVLWLNSYIHIIGFTCLGVIFLNMWIPFIRVFKRKSYIWILSSLVVILGMAKMLTLLNFSHQDLSKEHFYSHNLLFNQDIQLPESIYKSYARGLDNTRLYITNDTTESSARPYIIASNRYLRLDEVADFISSQENEPIRFLPQIGVCRNIRMKYVEDVKNQMSRFTPVVFFLTDDKSNLYSSYNSHSGFTVHIGHLNKNISATGYPPPPPPLKIENLDNPKIIDIHINDTNHISLEGKENSISELGEKLSNLLDTSRVNVIRLTYSDESEFDTYASVYQSILLAKDINKVNLKPSINNSARLPKKYKIKIIEELLP